MKKVLRFTAFILCAVMLCMVLCSCQYLDERKERRAVYNDAEEQSLTFKDNVYKHMEINSALAFIIDDSYYFDYCYATAEDVPVLLSGSFGDNMFYSHDGNGTPAVIGVYKQYKGIRDPIFGSTRIGAASTGDIDGYDEFYSDYKSDAPWYYVREDKYDEVKKIIETAELDHYFTNVYNDSYDETDGYAIVEKETKVLIDDDIAAAVDRTMKDGEVKSWSDLTPGDNWVNIRLYSCDKDITVTDEHRQPLVLTDGFDFYIHTLDEYSKLYKVSDDDFKTLHKLYKMAGTQQEYEDVIYYQGGREYVDYMY